MVEVHVQRGKNHVMEIVLDVGELFVQIPYVVVIDQGDGANHAALGRFPGFFDELVANEIAEGFRPVGIAALSNEAVELIEEVRVDRYTNPAEAAHAYTY